MALMTTGATTETCFFSTSALTSVLINSHRKLLRAKICPARSMAAEKVPQIRKQSAADYQHRVKSDFVYSNGCLCAPEPSAPERNFLLFAIGNVKSIILGNLIRILVGTSGQPRSTRLTTDRVSAEHEAK